MSNRFAIQILMLGCALAPALLHGDVVDSAAGGFTVKETISIQAPPQEVYRKIFKIGEWWNSQHTFSGDAHNLSLEEKAGGCLCEKLPNGGAAKHLEVMSFTPDKAILLHGVLGPLEMMAAGGSMQIQLTAEGGGTKLEVTHTVGGYSPAGLNVLAGPVDSVLKEQFLRLKSYVEKK